MGKGHIPNEKLKRERELRGLSQEELAEAVGTTDKIVSRWECGESMPRPYYRQKLIELFGRNAEELGFTVPIKVPELSHPSTSPRTSTRPIHVPRSSEKIEALVPVDEQGRNDSNSTSAPTQQPITPGQENNVPVGEEDWGEAPNLEQFYGRDKELLTLERWVVDDHCRLVALLGKGGIGKTSLAVAVAIHAKEVFPLVFWRSLQNAPSLKSVLQDCIHFVSHQQRTDLPENVDDQISLLLQYFREQPCLMVLDNVEIVLQGGKGTGCYREGYDGYGRLLQRIGEAKHQSCLLLTSREKPEEVALLEGSSSPVRTYRLEGLAPIYGRAILRDKGSYGEEQAWEVLVNHYGGNPLSLKLVSQFIREVFDGNIAGFLADGEMLFSDVYTVLDQQFERLSALEQEVMYWLAIEREPVSLKAIQEDMVRPVITRVLQEALRSLRRRDLLETSQSGFALQNVVMEYVTDRFVDRVYDEITAEAMTLFENHALVKAQTKEYVRESQVRLILLPIAQRLLSAFGKDEIERAFKGILSTLRSMHSQRPNYAAGNVLNLLIHLHCDLRGYDFSHLTVRQAYLQGAVLQGVNFAQANLATSVFTDTFGSILSVAFSPNGKLLAAGTSNSEVRLWQLASSTPVQTFQEHKDWVRSVAFNVDGSTIASCSNDQTVRLWEVSSGRCLRTMQGHINRVWSVAFNPDGSTIASGGDDQLLRLWEVSSGRCLKTFQGHTHRINSVVFSPDGCTIASGSEDQTVRLWEVSSGQCLKVLQGHTGWIRSVAFSPDGSSIASGSSDQTVRLWEVSSGQCLKTLRGHAGWVYSVAFSLDSSTVASGSGDQTVRLWEVNSGQCLKVLQGHTGWVRSTAFSPDGSTVVSSSEDQTMRLWEVNSGRCLKTMWGYSKRITCVALSCNGNVIASGGDELCLWEVSSGRCLKALHGHSSWVYSVAFSPNGSAIATSSSDHTVRVWEVSSGKCFKVLQGHNKCVWSVAFSPDGKTLASGSNDQTVRVWEVSSGQCLKVLQGHIGWVYSVAFNPVGSIIASGGDDQNVRLWEVSSGRCIKTLQGHINRVWSVAFSPNGSTIASSGDDLVVRVWEVSSGQCLKELQGHTRCIRSIAFSPDGSTIVSGSEDQTVRLWDANSGQCLKVLQGHSSSVRSVVFGHSGDIVVSGSDDGTTKCWNTQTGECLKTLRRDRPYERMNITGITGVTEAQKATLKILGASEDEEGIEMRYVSA